MRQRLTAKFPHHLSKDGDFVVRSDRTMVGSLNVADCLDKLRNSLRDCVDEMRAKSPPKSQQNDLELQNRSAKEARRRLAIAKSV